MLDRSRDKRAFCCRRMSTTDASSQKTSFAAPFRHTAFAGDMDRHSRVQRGLLDDSAASGWLMTSLNPDPLVVALVQAANGYFRFFYLRCRRVPSPTFSTSANI